jgi:drug/metabolite transporter (DMT)-like permease
MTPTAGFVALVLGATSISLGVIAVKQGYAEGASPEDLIATRLLVAAPFVALALAFVVRRAGPVGVRPTLVAVASGALIWISVRGELEGLERLPAGALALLLATSPVFVALLDWVGERRVPRRADVAAMMAIVVGVGVMAAPVGATVDAVGVLGGLVSALGFAGFLFVLDRNRRVSPARAFPLGILGAALAVLLTDPASVATLDAGLSPWLVLALGASAAGWAVLVGAGLQATTVVTAAIVVAVEPVLVSVLAYLILGEGLSARQLIGGAIVVGALAGVALHLVREQGMAAS